MNRIHVVAVSATAVTKPRRHVVAGAGLRRTCGEVLVKSPQRHRVPVDLVVKSAVKSARTLPAMTLSPGFSVSPGRIGGRR